MRILHLINSLSTGGAERIVVDLALECRILGHEVKIVILSPSLGIPARHAVDAGLEVQALGGHRFDPRIVTRLGAATRGWDIVHAHLFPAQYWSAMSRRPIVYTEHSTSNRRMHQRPWTLPEKVSYERFAHLIAISDGVRSELQRHLNQLRVKKPITVIHNGIRSEFFDSPISSRRSGPDVRLVSVGSLRRVKNVPLAIQAVAQVPESTLDIVGDGPLRRELTGMIQGLGVADRVRLLGSRNDIPSLLPQYDALLCTSHYEGFSLAAAEALAAGLPVIGPNVPGLTDVVQDNLSGVLYREPVPHHVVSAIRRIIDMTTYEELKKHTRTEARRFAIQSCAERHLDLYERILDRSE